MQDSKAELRDEKGRIVSCGFYLNDQPAGAWKHFDENGRMIDVKHYSVDRVVRELDVNDLSFRTYSNKEIGVQFIIPQYWKEEQSPDPSLFALFTKISPDGNKP